MNVNRARAGVVAAILLAATAVAAPAGADAADVAPGVPIEVLPFEAEASWHDPQAGGPGTAAANDAVARACNGGHQVWQPQWFTLPTDPATGTLRFQAQTFDVNPRSPDELPTGRALVETATGRVLDCAPELVTPAAVQLSLVTWVGTLDDPTDCGDWDCPSYVLDIALDPTSGVRPDNDDIASARTIPSLPFTDTVDTTLATTDGPVLYDGEHCLLSVISPVPRHSVWWKYTPAVAAKLPGGTPVGEVTPSGIVRAPRVNEAEDPWDCDAPIAVEPGRTYVIGSYEIYDDYYDFNVTSGGPVTLRLGDVPEPGAARRVAASVDAAARTATLSWEPPADEGTSPVTGYRVSRTGVDSGGAGAWSAVLPVTARSQTFTALNPWDAYQLTVQPVNAHGVGTPVTRTVAAQGPAPSAPRSVAVTAGPGSATVTWAPPARSGGSAVSGYRIRRFDGSGWTVRQTVTVPATARSWTATGLDDRGYSYEVVALNGSGPGRAARSGVVAATGSLPGAPQLAAAVVSEPARSVTIGWTPAAGGPAVTGYRVSRDGTDNGGAGPWTTTVPATVRSFAFTQLTSAAPYTLSVQAVSSAGVGPAATLSARLHTPERPQAVRSAAGDRRATVTWHPPAVPGTSPVTHYRIRRYQGETLQATSSVPAGARSFAATGLANGTAYTFDVTALNASGTGRPSARTAPVTPATVPGAPVIGTAAPGAAGGAVTATAGWAPPAATGGSPVTGYRVTALRIGSAGQVLGSTVSGVQPAAARTLQMTLPQPGDYRFTVQALNAVGPGPSSARSGLVAGR